MLTALKDYKGKLEVNGKQFDTIQQARNAFKTFEGRMCIKLYANAKNVNKSELASKNTDDTQYKITVRPYMTKKASPEFDFMAKFNNDNPMPLRTMTGTIEKETKGMYYMHLHAVAQDDSVNCMRCGRALTNPISKHYGIGPECIQHVPWLAEMAIEDVAGIRTKMAEVKWSGWVIKSSITEQEVVQ